MPRGKFCLEYAFLGIFFIIPYSPKNIYDFIKIFSLYKKRPCLFWQSLFFPFGFLKYFFQKLPRITIFHLRHLFGRALTNDFAAAATPLGAKVYNIIRRFDYV